jgi:hypothetical protein
MFKGGGTMKINGSLIIGAIVTLMALYYWIAIGSWGPISKVPMVYRFSFRLFPYFDIAFTAAGVWALFQGFRKLRE